MNTPELNSDSEVTVVIVSWNTRDLLADAVRSVVTVAGSLTSRIVVVDNASSDGSASMVREAFPSVTVIENATNEGFGAANNRGAAASTESYVLFLNSDAELQSGTLAVLVEELERHPEAAMVGARLVHADGSFQASFADFPGLWDEASVLFSLPRLLRSRRFPTYPESESRVRREADWVGAACALVRRSAFDAVGGFDASLHMYSEELDICRRLRAANWTIRYAGDAIAYHHGGRSTAQRAIEQPTMLWDSRLRYHRRYGPAGRAATLSILVSLAYALRAVAWTAGAVMGPPERRGEDMERAKAARRVVFRARALGRS